LYLAPQTKTTGITYRPDYSKLNKEQQIYLRSEFKIKFNTLRSKFPQWNVELPHDSLSLDQIHDLYDYYIREIMISKETGQYKAYMVIFLMFIEVIGVKVLKLNMSGYTMSQLRIMNRYDALFIELGEKWLVSGGSSFPVEARICMMIGFNAVIFLVVRYLCSWMGIEGLADTLQNAIDKMINGSDILAPITAAPPPGVSNNVETAEDPAAKQEAPNSGNPLDGIMNAFSGIFGGNNGGGGIGETLAQIGTKITGAMQNNNNANKAVSQAKAAEATKKKINKKKLFSDD
jgi:hypothetical protein